MPGCIKGVRRLRIVPLAEIADDAVEQLLDRAFGTDRRGRTAYLIRGGTTAIAELSFAAVADAGQLLATIQCWPVALHGDDGTAAPLVMVGPVAVDPHAQRAGLGQKLTRHMLAAAERSGQDGALMLIGDPEYYGRFFGFSAERTAAWRLPGPVERHRLLARGAHVPDRPGLVGPRLPVTA